MIFVVDVNKNTIHCNVDLINAQFVTETHLKPCVYTKSYKQSIVLFNKSITQFKMARKTSSTTKSKKTAAAAKVVEAAPPAVQENVVVEAAETTEVSLGDAFTSLLTQLTALRSEITKISGEVRALRTRSEREIRAAAKTSRRKRAANRAPSGFTKPTKISTELATFLGKDKGTEMARTEVTREINQYIVKHNLQDPKNGRVILPDNKLRKLLGVKKDETLTYFNLQKYMGGHFAKAGQTVA